MKTVIFFIGLLFFVPGYSFQKDKPKQSFSIQVVMKEHKGMLSSNLWPGFMLDSIPVAVYDSLGTYLFFSDDSLDRFRSFSGTPGTYYYDGQHPLVKGNSIVRMSGKWVATSVLTGYSARTGEKYSPKDLAGIIVHEQFHIFQRLMHPSWRPNDIVLLFYPPETLPALYLRKIEKESFRKAVASESVSDMAGWAELALKNRSERLDKLASIYSDYEKQLQRTEGLSDYIEKRARDADPLSSPGVTRGIAPAGIRDLGYVEGRWMAVILDKLDRNWKDLLQNSDNLFLEDILGSAVRKIPHNTKSFSSAEMENIREETENVFNEWQLDLREELQNYTKRSGYSIEINSSANPLDTRMFEPLETEILPDRTVFNRLFFSAASQRGSVRIAFHPCLTHFDESYRLVSTKVFGIIKEPVIQIENKKFILKADNIDIELTYSSIEKSDTGYIITI